MKWRQGFSGMKWRDSAEGTTAAVVGSGGDGSCGGGGGVVGLPTRTRPYHRKRRRRRWPVQRVQLVGGAGSRAGSRPADYSSQSHSSLRFQ